MFFTKTKQKNKTKTPEQPEIESEIRQSIKLTYEDLRQQIRELAYQKWEQADKPWGKDKEFWIEAEKELFGENPLAHGGYKLKNNESYFIVCPINSEVAVEIKK